MRRTGRVTKTTKPFSYKDTAGLIERTRHTRFGQPGVKIPQEHTKLKRNVGGKIKASTFNGMVNYKKLGIPYLRWDRPCLLRDRLESVLDMHDITFALTEEETLSLRKMAYAKAAQGDINFVNFLARSTAKQQDEFVNTLKTKVKDLSTTLQAKNELFELLAESKTTYTKAKKTLDLLAQGQSFDLEASIEAAENIKKERGKK